MLAGKLLAAAAGYAERQLEERYGRFRDGAGEITPLVVLALLSFAGGWMGWPAFMGGNNAIEHWFEPVFHHEVVMEAHPGEVDAHLTGTYAAADANAAGIPVACPGTYLVALP